MVKQTKNKEISCSFCGAYQSDVSLLIEGDSSHICDLCINKSKDILEQNKRDNQKIELLHPKDIKEKLDKYIIGQEKAKKVISVAVYNHYKRLFFNDSKLINIDKSNILLVGPTGTGKTLLAKTLAAILKVPFTIVDATVLTEAGYVGEDVENILVRLYHEAGYDIQKAQQGIIYIDEIDKIARKGSNPSITRDVSGEGVQQSLLKIIEGSVANIAPEGGRKHPEQPLIKIDTTNILFICGGTFDGLNPIIERRIKGNAIGFGTIKDLGKKIISNTEIQSEDIVNYGFLPELIGRLPILSSLESLSKKALFSILTQPVNSIVKQYKHLFKIDNVDLIFTEGALKEIVNKAVVRNIGARALRSIIEEVMTDIMYEIPSKKNIKSCTINRDVIMKKAKPKLLLYKKTA